MPKFYGCVKGAIYGTDQPLIKDESEVSPIEWRPCQVCGKHIPSWRHGSATTCSTECAKVARAMRNRAYYHRKKECESTRLEREDDC